MVLLGEKGCLLKASIVAPIWMINHLVNWSGPMMGCVLMCCRC
jgi:hypothetical protein